jgi:hypothetical protein
MIFTNNLALVLTSKSKYEAAFNCGDLEFVLSQKMEVRYFDDSSELPDRIKNKERMKNAALWIIFGKDDTNNHDLTDKITSNLILRFKNQEKLSVRTLRFHFMYGCGCVTTSFILKKLFQDVNIFKWIQCTSIFFWNINLSEISNPSKRWLNMVLADETSSLTFEQCTIDGLRITASELGSGILSLEDISIIGPFFIQSGIIVLNSNLSKPMKKHPVIKVLNANRVFEEHPCNFIPETSSTMRIELNTELFPSPWPQLPVPQPKPQPPRVQQPVLQPKPQPLRVQQPVLQPKPQPLRVQQPVLQPWPQPFNETDIENVLSLILTCRNGDVSSYRNRMRCPNKATLIQFGKSTNLPNEINESMDKTELQIVFATYKSDILDNFHKKLRGLKNLNVSKLSLDFSMCDNAMISSVISHGLFCGDSLFSKITYSHIVWKGVRLDMVSPFLNIVVIKDIVIDFENCKIGEIRLSIPEKEGQQGHSLIKIRIYPPFYLEGGFIRLKSNQPKFPIKNLLIMAQNAQEQMYPLDGRKYYSDNSKTLNIKFDDSFELGEFPKQYDCCVPI